MKNLLIIAFGTVPLLTTVVSFAQSGNMMNGGAWGNSWMGGYGGIWMPILMIAVIVALVSGLLNKRNDRGREVCTTRRGARKTGVSAGEKGLGLKSHAGLLAGGTWPICSR